jgi:Protein of unknown function (DUF3754)
MTTGNGHDTTSEERDQFIPVRKSDILDALVDNGQLADDTRKAQFCQVCRMLGAIYHYEYFERLEILRRDYYYFNPELDRHARIKVENVERAYGDLITSFTAVLRGANFVEVSHEEIERAHRESVLVNVNLSAPVEDFREVRFFRRGHHQETFELRKWFGLRRQKIDAVVYDDVILLVATKPEEEPNGKKKRKKKRMALGKIRPGAVLLKYFRNIASADLNALYPNIRVVMSLFDKLSLSVPALVGGIPILFKLASTITVLFLVVGFYLGISAAIHEDQMKSALAALSGLVALGGFLMQQWVKYQRQSLKYQKELTDNVYYRNINNNAGIFDYIIGAAEEQECKEAFLAYYFLSTSPTPLTEDELDQRIEKWLLDKFSIDIDFEVDDALSKLERLELLRRDGDRLSVPPPEDALVRLDYHWDNYFQYNVQSQPAKATTTEAATAS